MQSSGIFMGTTEVSVSRSVAEISTLLVKAGANAIHTEYAGGGEITGMSFTIALAGKRIYHYRMPVRSEKVYATLVGQRSRRSRTVDKLKGQAERIAWRQLYRWVQAQLAMVDLGMAAADEVFLPYCQDNSGRTVYQLFQEQQFNALAAPGE